MLNKIKRTLNNFFNKLKQQFKQWSRPNTTAVIPHTLLDLTRNRADLITENALLRQQLIILKRQVKRVKLNPKDRLSLILTARLTQ